MTAQSKTYSFQKYAGIAGVVIIWTGITVAMHRAHLGLIDVRPISYLGVNPGTDWIFSTSLLVSALFFLIFGFELKNKLKLNNLFIQLLVIGQVGQITAAIVPYGGRYKLVHTIAAYVLAFSLPFLIQQFAKSQSGSTHTTLYRYLLGIEILTFIVGIGIFSFTKGIAPLGEALPAIGFHIWIIVVTLTTIRQ